MRGEGTVVEKGAPGETTACKYLSFVSSERSLLVFSGIISADNTGVEVHGG